MTIKFIKTTDIGFHKIRRGEKTLKEFKKLNIFVGKNNSGKSRFLRHLIKNRHDLIDQKTETLFSQIYELHRNLAAVHPSVKDDPTFLISELAVLIRRESKELPNKLSEFRNKLERITRENGDTSRANSSRRAIATQILAETENFNREHYEDKEVIYAYIPILRGLRPLVRGRLPQPEVYSSEDCYADRTKSDYFEKPLDENVLVFSGLDLYEQIRDMLLSSSRAERDFVKSFEKFLSTHFFNDQEIILTPTKDKDVISISIAGDEKPIYHLGDGIQSIICNIFLAYKYKDKSTILFIEEPEIYLHPSMQRILVEVLLTELKHTQIFITTHSNHFLDLVYDYEKDVAIFSFQKEADNFYIDDITANREIIDILGVRNSSVYLANCVIWVEGVSDRIYIRKFLQLYAKENNLSFKEDHEFAICEYGGGNIENFDFIDSSDGSDSRVNAVSISSKNLIIADNDGKRGATDKKGERLRNLKELLGDSFYDEYIEIENLIPYKIYKEALIKLFYRHPNKSLKLKDAIKTDEKNFNEGLASKKIGRLLKSYLVEKKIDTQKLSYFKVDNVECLGEKKKYIADLIVTEIDKSGITFSELPTQAQDVVVKIIQFIRKNNVKQKE